MPDLFLSWIFLLQVLCIELFGHGTPNLCTLHVCNEATFHQIQPICLVQLWSNQKIEITNSLIFTDKRSCRHDKELDKATIYHCYLQTTTNFAINFQNLCKMIPSPLDGQWSYITFIIFKYNAMYINHDQRINIFLQSSIPIDIENCKFFSNIQSIWPNRRAHL